ncbi:MAG: hypothetical protein U9O55_00085 [Patescibacteria group bacterium]|nr:hypothetical protein [Patescibacteria group bacterium]
MNIKQKISVINYKGGIHAIIGRDKKYHRKNLIFSTYYSEIRKSDPAVKARGLLGRIRIMSVKHRIKFENIKNLDSFKKHAEKDGMNFD